MIKSVCLGALIAALTCVAALAQAMTWQVGEHVMIGSIGQQGTIIAVIGQQMMNGGTLVKVHLDLMGPAFPTIGVTYDTVTNQVSPMGAAPQAAPQQTTQPQQYQPQYQQPMPQPQYQQPVQQQYQQPVYPQQQTYAAPATSAPAGDGPPGMGPPPPMNAPANPGYGPAQ